MNQILPKLNTNKLPALAKLKMNEVSFPELYQQARTALQALIRVDEIKEVLNKHEAIACYAKQVRDDSLLQYAKRVKLRAYERMGALLLELPDIERTKVAQENHIGPALQSQAMRMQNIPPRVRDKLIDQKIPATMRELGSQGDNYDETRGLSRDTYGNRYNHWEREKEIAGTIEVQSGKVAEYMDSYTIDLKYFQTNGQGEEVYTPYMLGYKLDPERTSGIPDLIKDTEYCIRFYTGFLSGLKAAQKEREL